ncbi:MAG: DUF4199 domain-containing protein [Saprospiraceae bacterium]
MAYKLKERLERQDKQLHNNPPKTRVAEGFNLARRGRNYGILTGVIMAVYLVIINVALNDPSFLANLPMHLVFIPILGLALNAYKRYLPEGKIFKDGIQLGGYIAGTAAVTIIIINAILSLISPKLSFQQFYNEGNSFPDVMINGIMLAMTVFVFGMLITFIYIQFMKDDKPADG